MKKLITALAAAAMLASASTGTLAAGYTSMGHCDALKGDSSDWDTVPLKYKLRENGVSYSEIGIFGNCFSVIEITPEGTKKMVLYDPSTLNRIHGYP